jgi:membrane protease YdiL (CAAX protease family)
MIVLGTILTAGILRQFHERIPSSPYLPWPVRSLLFFLVLIFFLAFLRGWKGRQEVPYAGPGLRRVNFLAFLPLLIALTLEKWVSITFYSPVFSWLNGSGGSTERQHALYVIEAGAGLLLVTVFLLPLFRRIWRLLGRYLSLPNLLMAIGGIALTVVLLFAGLAVLLKLSGFPEVRLRWAGLGPIMLPILAGQALIAFSEEIYYRGILQTELGFLLPSLGVTRTRSRTLAAVGLTSVAFSLEHLVFVGTITDDLRRCLFIFGCSIILGALLVLVRNLWYNAGCHFVLNLFVLGTDPARYGSGLQFVDDLGRPIFDPGVYIFFFFTLAFILTYVNSAIRSRLRPRAPGRDPVAAA